MSTSCWSHRRVPFGCHQRLDRSNARLPPFPHRLFFGVPGPGPGQKEKEGKVNRRDGISTRDFPRIRSGTHPPPVPVVRVCPWYQPPGRRRSTQPACWAVQGPKIPRMREDVNVASRGPRVVPWVGVWVCLARLVSLFLLGWVFLVVFFGVWLVCSVFSRNCRVLPPASFSALSVVPR